MKHLNVALLFGLLIGFTTVAQKKELKTADKAFKNKQFVVLKEAVAAAEPLMESADDKLKAQFYYLKAMSLFGKGGNMANDEKVATQLLDLIAFEKQIKKIKYTKQAKVVINKIVKRSAEKGRNFYEKKNYKTAAEKFELVYTLSPRDTVYLENAALAAYNAKDYNKSIKLYKKLLDMGYTGIFTQYSATSTANGETIYFGSQKEMDAQLNLKIVSNPKVKKMPSKVGDIAKNIALNYISKGDNQGALKAIEDAKKVYPNDYSLIISEANIHLKLKNDNKFLELMQKAIEIKPNEPQLHYNVGVILLNENYPEKAKVYFENAIRIKPDFAEAHNNLGVIVLRGSNPIIDEMNKSLSDFKKYDALQLKLNEVYKAAIPHYEKAHEYNPKEESTIKTLIGLYESLEMYDKQKALKTVLDNL